MGIGVIRGKYLYGISYVESYYQLLQFYLLEFCIITIDSVLGIGFSCIGFYLYDECKQLFISWLYCLSEMLLFA